mmetsp:Transcript_35064/g.84628  ORF Transcript_35064/g.84628 Transcript_35064/m.84628 type:complete len:219 (+) Transcript_35064:552-1208(+)
MAMATTVRYNPRCRGKVVVVVRRSRIVPWRGWGCEIVRSRFLRDLPRRRWYSDVSISIRERSRWGCRSYPASVTISTTQSTFLRRPWAPGWESGISNPGSSFHLAPMCRRRCGGAIRRRVAIAAAPCHRSPPSCRRCCFPCHCCCCCCLRIPGGIRRRDEATRVSKRRRRNGGGARCSWERTVRKTKDGVDRATAVVDVCRRRSPKTLTAGDAFFSSA